MARNSADWNSVRNGFWGAALGLAGGGALILSGVKDNLVLLIICVAVAVLAALIFGRRGRSQILATTATNGAGDAAALPPLAREIFERLPDPLLLLDASGRVVFANKGMATAVGTDPLKKHISAVLRMPAVLNAIEKTVETGEPTSVAFSTPVPVERHYQAYATRMEQSPRLTALLLHDVTAVIRAEEARADFIANASHELRTPLAAVSGFIDTLRGHAKDDEAAREQFLDIMSQEAGRMRRLIDDLLSLTRIELNEHVPPSGTVDIVALARNAAAALQSLARVDNVTVTVTDAPGLPPIRGDRDELIQLLQNLIHNAIKYGREGGHVGVSFALTPGPAGRRAQGAMVAVSVKDDGEGIPREAIPRLTERFYRVDVKRSRERGGTGLGLAIVKHIANRHGGRLGIESLPGEGSTFTVYLPTAVHAVTEVS
ncbi:MAG TPA: ATP-binding protein [Rhizomicrobium sp.]|jgi:two-component system phosphate regulon sensor histidine kinase PhoR